MYIPASFHEERSEALYALMRAHPLGTLITHGASGLLASPLPFLLDAASGKKGVLSAHMARANPHWKSLAGETECLVVFSGPDAYVTPDWYPGKAATHRVVPTWNYAAVHVCGTLRVIDEPAWLARQITDLTAAHEALRPAPWQPADAPEDFIAAQMKAVVGLEVAITAIEGKWKMSQNKEPADLHGVMRGMRDASDPHHNPAVADQIERCSKQ
jgi:transcriptional regulator